MRPILEKMKKKVIYDKTCGNVRRVDAKKALKIAEKALRRESKKHVKIDLVDDDIK